MRISGLCFASGLIVLSACGGQVGDEEEQSTNSAITSSGRVHMMLMHDPAKDGAIHPDSAPPGAHLTYFGGPLLTSVNAFPVYWNSRGTGSSVQVQFQSNLSAFYAAVPKSALYSMLSQYNVGHGGSSGHFVDNNKKSSHSFTDAQVQAELTRLINAHSVPAPNGNNYYPIHFAPGVSITAPDGSQSCVVFCAYHGTFVHNGVNVNYGVIPDQGGGCAGGCGNNPSRVNNLDSVSSHELVEATTDPAVGLATTFGPPLGWYDQNNGEIGDICNGQQGTTVGGDGKTYVIQLEFSNAANNCVSH